MAKKTSLVNETPKKNSPTTRHTPTGMKKKVKLHASLSDEVTKQLQKM